MLKELLIIRVVVVGLAGGPPVYLNPGQAVLLWRGKGWRGIRSALPSWGAFKRSWWNLWRFWKAGWAAQPSPVAAFLTQTILPFYEEEDEMAVGGSAGVPGLLCRWGKNEDGDWCPCTDLGGIYPVSLRSGEPADTSLPPDSNEEIVWQRKLRSGGRRLMLPQPCLTSEMSVSGYRPETGLVLSFSCGAGVHFHQKGSVSLGDALEALEGATRCEGEVTRPMLAVASESGSSSFEVLGRPWQERVQLKPVTGTEFRAEERPASAAMDRFKGDVYLVWPGPPQPNPAWLLDTPYRGQHQTELAGCLV